MRILNIFNKEREKQLQQKIIKNIHNDFNTKGEELIKEANEILNQSTYQSLKQKKDLLNNCGFSNTNLSQEIKLLENKINISKSIDVYYKNLNCLYKVVTLEQIQEITAKYKLCMARTDDYKSNVPDKNLKDIERFQNIYKKANNTSHFNIYNQLICAPESDFNKNSQYFIKYGMKIKLEDPIVLYPCNGELKIEENSYALDYMQLTNRYYYVVTAWGLEASDELVVNNKMN